MTNDIDDQAQPALWGHHDSVAPARGAARARTPMGSAAADLKVGELWTIDQVAVYLGVPKQTDLLLADHWLRAARVPRRQAPALACYHGPGLDGRPRARPVTQQRPCPRCGATIHEVWPRPAGRPRRWCFPRCRRAASEERRAAANGAIAIEYGQVEPALDDHVRAVLESPAACRRIIRDLRERAENGQLSDARWSSVEAELQRVKPGQRTQLRWGAR